ncbi:hypothetical protein VHEMI09676 [[Torrubiella] hemipterigena]|uniref:Uncharacterized protein n=1 Tax=[Torrubiella] hemipterigena TaxID=1531966 RepID=A0A0A1TAL0_9HYPO|nr:hypothetical protein VHEMI09676 [[Torrubiella] hemipterigena]
MYQSSEIMSRAQAFVYETPTTQNLGPLPTAFVPPARCAGITLASKGSLTTPDPQYTYSIDMFYAYTCIAGSAAPDPGCAPSGYADYMNVLQKAVDPRTGRFPVFSPGARCPEGYVPGCTMSKGQGYTTGSLRQWDLLAANETAIGCCPSGFTCDTTRQHFCLSSIASSQTVTFDNKLICNSTESQRGTGSWMLPPSIQARITAAQIVYIQTSADSKPPVSASSSNDASLSTSGETHKPPQASPEQTQLSAGAKAGIAISVVLASIFAALSGYLLYARNKRRHIEPPDSEAEAATPEPPSEENTPARMDFKDSRAFSAVSPATPWSETGTCATQGTPSDITTSIFAGKPAMSPDLWQHPALREDSRVELSNGVEVTLSELPGDESWIR